MPVGSSGDAKLAGGTIRITEIPSGSSWNQDSYLAGYNYTFDIPTEAQSWLHSVRTSYMTTHTAGGTEITQSTPWENGYYYDAGVFFWAEPLASDQSPRSAYVIVNATKNQELYDQLYPNGDGPNVCERSRLFVRQGATSGNTLVQYEDIDTISIGFRGASDVTNTHVNIAVWSNEMMPQSYWANGTIYGEPVQQTSDQNLYRLVRTEGDSITIDFKYKE